MKIVGMVCGKGQWLPGMKYWARGVNSHVTRSWGLALETVLCRE